MLRQIIIAVRKLVRGGVWSPLRDHNVKSKAHTISKAIPWFQSSAPNASILQGGSGELSSPRKYPKAELPGTNLSKTNTPVLDPALLGQTSSSSSSLTDEQEEVLDLVLNKGKNVFFTGSAGTGKSFLLREIISNLSKKYLYEPDRLAVTASTGIAASHIGGTTLHSFAGIGVDKAAAKELGLRILRDSKKADRWRKAKILIIDEISMIDAGLFDNLEFIARFVRETQSPFGGLQLILAGDFFQLPPVSKDSVAKFCFEAKAWNIIDHTIALTRVFRQKDPAFAEILNEMREGRLSSRSIQSLRDLSRPFHLTNDLEATELFPMRAEVDAANREKMERLDGETHKYYAKDDGTIQDREVRRRLLSHCSAAIVLELKKGAQVMLIRNIDNVLVNGSLGHVLGFLDRSFFARDRWYMEHHWSESELYDDGYGHNTGKKLYPVVRFALPNGSTRIMLCGYAAWTVEEQIADKSNGGKRKTVILARRSQVPLILSWALSIHKAQGQTLQLVKVDLGRVFEKGQAYVALSRVTSMNGLQVINFDPSKVMAEKKVHGFYKTLTVARLSTQPKLRG